VSWVYQITRHAIIDHYRAPTRRREMPAGLAADMETIATVPATPVVDDSEDSSEHRSELAGCLRPMIEQLDEDYREALMLVEFEGLTQQDAAKRRGLSLSASWMTVVSSSLISEMELPTILYVIRNDRHVER
jgi:RNA polymerase sigma-70 factor (ECF subfamily)